MKKRGILLACALLPLLSACSSQHAGTMAASSSASARQHNDSATHPIYSRLVNVPAGGTGASVSPVPLATAQAISGVIGIKRPGSIRAFDVQIGNYNNTSDGTLAVKLCVDDACSEGAASLAKSADNQYLEIPLQRSIDVRAGSVLHYSLTRTTGTRPLVVWAYSDAAAKTTMPNGENEQRVLKIGLRYQMGSTLTLTIGIAAALLLFIWLIHRKLDFRIVTVAGMVFAAGLILAMIVVAPERTLTHPDEVSHVAAYQYYVNHWLPPAVNDPATIPSTSVWGFSYLFELDVVYDIAARATSQLRMLTGDEWLACRLFQFALWSVLCILAMSGRRWAAILSVALLTPQVWYVFSYFNADAFPLFLSLIAAGLVSDERSGVHEFIRTGNMKRAAVWIAAVCMGLILVSKQTYLPVIPAFMLWLAVPHLNLRARLVVPILAGLLMLGTGVMLGGVLGSAPYSSLWHRLLMFTGVLMVVVSAAYIGWRHWKDVQTRRILLRLAGFSLMCVVIAMPRVAWDVHVNGWPAQKAARIHAVEEARAGQDFKPSTIAQHKGYPTSGLASRGVSFKHVFFAPYNWASTSLASAFGVYGYMNIYAPRWIYWILYGITGLFVLFAVYSVRVSRPRHWRALVAIVVGTSILILASSSLLSWIFTLQAQGRYCFAILPLIALLMGQPIEGWRRKAFALSISGGFVMAAASFAFVALPAFR